VSPAREWRPASLGLLDDRAKSHPGLGYMVTYAVGNTLLTIWAW